MSAPRRKQSLWLTIDKYILSIVSKQTVIPS